METNIDTTGQELEKYLEKMCRKAAKYAEAMEKAGEKGHENRLASTTAAAQVESALVACLRCAFSS